MKLFLSWSGEQSRKVAISLRDWLPCIFQSVVPFVSSEDLRKGKRWLLDMSQELENTTFGVICLTRENVASAWILFEAGALSRSVIESHACTLLLNGLSPTDVVGPLSHFQHTIFERSDFRKLLGTINDVLQEKKLKDDLLDRLFVKFWPDLAASVGQAFQDADGGSQQMRSDRELLEEVVTLSRFLARNTVKPNAEKSVVEEKNRLRKLLYLGVNELGLPQRIVIALEHSDIQNLGGLATRTRGELLKLKGIKNIDVDQIAGKLDKFGLSLGLNIHETLWTNSD